MTLNTSTCPKCGRIYVIDEDPSGFVAILDLGGTAVTSCVDCDTDLDIQNGEIVEAK